MRTEKKRQDTWQELRRTFRSKRRFAENLRKHPPQSEQDFNLFCLHQINRHDGRNNLKRSVVLFGYIADYYCWRKRLVIEIDGGSHAQSQGYDASRDAHLLKHRIKTLRFTHQQVLHSPQIVVNEVLKEIAQRPNFEFLPRYGTKRYIRRIIAYRTQDSQCGGSARRSSQSCPLRPKQEDKPVPQGDNHAGQHSVLRPHAILPGSTAGSRYPASMTRT